MWKMRMTVNTAACNLYLLFAFKGFIIVNVIGGFPLLAGPLEWDSCVIVFGISLTFNFKSPSVPWPPSPIATSLSDLTCRAGSLCCGAQGTYQVWSPFPLSPWQLPSYLIHHFFFFLPSHPIHSCSLIILFPQSSFYLFFFCPSSLTFLPPSISNT